MVRNFRNLLNLQHEHMEKINDTRFSEQLFNKLKRTHHELGWGLRIEEAG